MAIFAGSHPVLGPASPLLLGVRPLWGHLRGLAPRFGTREPVAPWREAPLGPSLRARTPFWAREPVAPWRGAPRWPSLRARTPFWGPRARRSLARGPSGAIPAGSQICGYEVCRAGGGGARGAEPASGWRRDVFSSLGGPRFALRLPVRSVPDRTGHQSPLRLNDTKTRIFSTLAWKRINKKLTVKSRIVCRPSAIISRVHTLESPFLKKKVLRNEENP